MWLNVFPFSIFVLLIPLFLGCEEKIEPGRTVTSSAPVVKARVAVAHLTHQPRTHEAVGTVVAGTAATVSSKVMGVVKRVHVKEGDTVRRGDLLVTIDDMTFQSRLREAEASLGEARKAEAAALSAVESTKAASDLAHATYVRYLGLLADQSVSRQELDEVEARERQSRAALAQAHEMAQASRQRVKQAEAAVSGAAVPIMDATILAPYEGIVTAKWIQEGDLASPGTSLLALEKDEGYRAELVVPEAYYYAVKVNEKVTVTIPALGERSVEGVIGVVVPAADPQSRSFIVKVDLPRGEGVRAGMFVRAAIATGEEDLMLAPATAIVHEGGLTGLYLVTSDQTARFRLVRTGRAFGDLLEVISGLKPGDRFLVDVPPQISDGARVEAGP
jgi:multidrug efflux pump subunit AcrA (membrane-fusion protein)